ncbi:glucose-6-phosphate 1-dehydrogenase [Brevibacillus reuszeri]|uniref:Glucose-6-phosphate 1-dehydrogenase n=1 Tax=Brevibacillus reuszeri TaxID=54915 RepID=A0A0K9YUZ6_9BACL|nr:glucose-6-phosphate dehydrogenase [Brevibacillus reuszeri]KNB72523.1 glucose-6-phosphate dehydrogenase [Brevibacillus reuszeri]MED1860799.1 glucose-6-phosphate dehydrogenase [Brevibacillus reuszeri]GED70687.1 glucose-6-phosphate 1-dehydrogenase [Brevibacillus reuszeri]
MKAMTFVLFGATGDLAKRKIFPALFNLYVDQKLPASYAIVGVGRRTYTVAEFLRSVEQSVSDAAQRREVDSSCIHAFLSTIRYVSVDVTQKDDYLALLGQVIQCEQEWNLPQNRLFYLSVAPEFFDVIAGHIKASGLCETTGWKRLIIEKPFGRDLQSAEALNEKLCASFAEEEIYRIDHYLGKPMVRNLEAIEFANPIFQAIWNNKYIANVQITANETVGVEDRAGYYDHAGALRDMVQNHMLQLLMMIAMHLPNRINAKEIRKEKRKVMEAVRPMETEDVMRSVVRGQYGAGNLQGHSVVSYRDEPGVEADSMTDTFVALRVWIDDPLWSGVPFYIRTGKRIKEKSTKIIIEFKNPLEGSYRNQQTAPNLLILNINPEEGISLQVNQKNAAERGKLEPVTVDFSTDASQAPEAYELLLSDAIQGDSTYFAHWMEVKLAWKWVTPILEAFAQNQVPLHVYPAGSYGPQESAELLMEQGFSWWQDEEREREMSGVHSR